MDVADPTPNFAAAQKSLNAFLAKIEKQSRVVCLHDSDADGLTAGVVWQRALEKLGFTNLKRLSATRERNAFLPQTKEIIVAENPDFLFVMDLGSQPNKIVENVPTCFIDHHRPGGVLPVHAWNELLEKMGFSENVFAKMD